MGKTWVGLICAVSIALAGCGAGTDGGGGSSASPSGSSTSASPGGDAKPALPKGAVWQKADEAKLTVAVPGAWTAMKPQEIIKSGDPKVIDDVAKKMGVTPEQFKQALGNTTLMVVAPPIKGYADNLTGVLVPIENLPTESQLKAQLAGAADGPITVRNEKTPAGDAVVSEMVLKIGSLSVHSYSHFIKTDDGIYNLTVSSSDAGRGKSVSKQLLSTVHKS